MQKVRKKTKRRKEEFEKSKEKRYITPRECARLQSFPETFKLSPDDKKSYKQLGNSVNVNNVYTVISSTLKKYV